MEKTEEKFLQTKIRVIEIFYNLVSMGDKVKQISNLPQNKTVKIEEVRNCKTGTALEHINGGWEGQGREGWKAGTPRPYWSGPARALGVR